MPASSFIEYRVTFTRYKLGSPVLYLLRVEALRSLPADTFAPLNHANSESNSPPASSDESQLVYLGCWNIKRRFSELLAFHEKIKAKLKPVFKAQHLGRFPDFAPKVLGNSALTAASALLVGAGSDETAVQERLLALQEYFDKLTSYGELTVREMGEILNGRAPDCLPAFRVTSFGVHTEGQVYAVCEITDEHTRQLFQRASAKLAHFGAPVHHYTITISRVLPQGFGGESIQFVREDRLDNIGTGMRVNLLLGPGDSSYEIGVKCENWFSCGEDGLRIRVVAPTVEDILAAAGNEETQVSALVDRISSSNGGASSKRKSTTNSVSNPKDAASSDTMNPSSGSTSKGGAPSNPTKLSQSPANPRPSESRFQGAFGNPLRLIRDSHQSRGSEVSEISAGSLVIAEERQDSRGSRGETGGFGEPRSSSSRGWEGEESDG